MSTSQQRAQVQRSRRRREQRSVEEADQFGERIDWDEHAEDIDDLLDDIDDVLEEQGQDLAVNYVQRSGQ